MLVVEQVRLHNAALFQRGPEPVNGRAEGAPVIGIQIRQGCRVSALRAPGHYRLLAGTEFLSIAHTCIPKSFFSSSRRLLAF